MASFPDPDEGDDEDDDYEVGYCRPPKHSRFPNQANSGSGRGGGRKKAKADHAAVVRRVATTRVKVRLNGRNVTMTMLGLVILSIRTARAKGNLKAAALSRKFQGWSPLEEDQAPRGVLIGSEKLTDEEWMKRFGHPAVSDEPASSIASASS